MTDLEIKIQKAAQKYYTDGTSEYSDEEFDALVDQLRREQPDSILFRVGWGYDVSEDSTPGTKREHKYTTIGSLDKCHDVKELGKEFLGVPLDFSTKLDGLSVVLYYEKSLLKYALTRGDSKIGIDVTDKVLKINPIFAHTRFDFTGAVRGEIIMSFDSFEKFRVEHPDAKNPRNSTAGLVNGKDTFEDLKYLDIILYTLVHNDAEDSEATVSGTRAFLGLLFDPSIVVKSLIEKIPFSCTDDQLMQKMNAAKNYLYQDYPADGIVVHINNTECEVGTYVYTAKAFKFPAESKITKIIDVEWNMSKTKNAVPRILLEPVQLSGTTVQACAGYNAQYIRDNDLGPGSVVEVRKSGEIIPQVINIIQSTKANLPTTCPDCGEPLSWEGVHLVCTNTECSNSIEQDLLVWLQNLVPLDNLGDTLKLKFINQLVQNGYIEDTSIEEVMRCKIHLDEETPSVQFNNFAKMWNNLHNPDFKFDLVHALIACNIPRIGDLTAIKFAKYPKKILELLDSNENTYIFVCADIMSSKILGEANTLSLQKHINKFRRLHFIQDRINWNVEPQVQSKGKVAITGKLSVKREAFEEELRRHGWEPTSSVNKDTKFLITDNPKGQSSKNLAATRYNIPKINEFDFRLKYLD